MDRKGTGACALMALCGILLAGPAAADLVMTIDISDSGDPVMNGTMFTYTIEYNLDSPATVSGVIVDQLPEEVSFVSATGGGLYDSGTHTVRWDVPATSGISTVSVTVNPDRVPFPACSFTAAGPVVTVNTATISAPPSPETVTVTETTGVVATVPVCIPEFPSALVPAGAAAGFLTVAGLTRRTRR